METVALLGGLAGEPGSVIRRHAVTGDCSGSGGVRRRSRRRVPGRRGSGFRADADDAARALDLVHGRVGLRDQLLTADCGGAGGRHANRAADASVVLSEHEVVGERGAYALGDRDGVIEGREVLAEDKELVAAEAADEIVRPDRAGETVGDRAEEPVTDRVAELVVDLLEAVEVD